MKTNEYKDVNGSSKKNTKYKDYPQKITLLVVFAVAMVINSLAGSGKIGVRVGAISDLYNTLITPPGYTFSIWGLIYTLWGLFVLLQLLPNKFLSQPEMLYSLSAKGRN